MEKIIRQIDSLMADIKITAGPLSFTLDDLNETAAASVRGTLTEYITAKVLGATLSDDTLDGTPDMILADGTPLQLKVVLSDAKVAMKKSCIGQTLLLLWIDRVTKRIREFTCQTITADLIYPDRDRLRTVLLKRRPLR